MAKTRKQIFNCCLNCDKRHPVCWSDCPDYAERKKLDADAKKAMQKSEAELYSIAQSCKNKDKRARRK